MPDIIGFMNWRERLAHLESKKDSKSYQIESDKIPEEVTVNLLDVQEEEDTNELQLAPGLYFVIRPIPPVLVRDWDSVTQTVDELALSFHEILEDKGLVRKSKRQILIDENIIELDNIWEFSPQGYREEVKLLVVRAGRVDPEWAEKQIKEKIFKRGRGSLPEKI